jgi:glyceraldehyde 3-phosphate dehydrogenase
MAEVAITGFGRTDRAGGHRGGSPASIVDLGMTQVVGGDLAKVMAWYDKEWGHAAQLAREARRVLAG